jgi:FKBP-type peptidyl-prolyl cis-trans isomerase (trigger factor)
MIHELEAQVQGMGMQLDQYLEQMKKTREDLERDWKPQAEKRLKAALALEQVAKDIKGARFVIHFKNASSGQ